MGDIKPPIEEEKPKLTLKGIDLSTVEEYLCNEDCVITVKFGVIRNRDRIKEITKSNISSKSRFTFDIERIKNVYVFTCDEVSYKTLSLEEAIDLIKKLMIKSGMVIKVDNIKMSIKDGEKVDNTEFITSVDTKEK